MQFAEKTKPIYLQIADRICDDISAGRFLPQERIPSVREYAEKLQVNFNTVMRSFEFLATHAIIFNKRGVGYFISDDALQNIAKMREATFFNDELIYFFGRLRSIGVTPETLLSMYSKFYNQ